MISCQDVHAALLDFVAGQVGPEQSARIRGHVKRCPGCRQHVTSYCQVIRLSRRLPRRRLPPHLKDRLRALLRRLRPREQQAEGSTP